MSFDSYRDFFAEELRAVGNVTNDALVAAFARVRREDFLGPGPWQIPLPEITPGAPVVYRTTPDDDPRRLYHNVPVAIDPARSLNNGQPGSLAMWIDSLGVQPSEVVLHIGCGVGYYTAILAELVGPAGRVIAVETDVGLAERATKNLGHLPHVNVVHTDGAAYAPGPFDAALINAGVTRLPAAWLDGLKPSGRLLLPLTFSADPAQMGVGFMLRVSRDGDGYRAQFTSGVAIYPCIGARDAESKPPRCARRTPRAPCAPCSRCVARRMSAARAASCTPTATACPPPALTAR